MTTVKAKVLTIARLAILIFAILTFCYTVLIAADCTTTADETWSCGTPSGSDNITVNHTATINSNLALTGNITVNSGGILTITGDLNATVGTITVEEGGTLVIEGNVNLGANCTLIINGVAQFYNTFTTQNSASVTINGTLTVQGISTIEEGGSLDISPFGSFITNSDLLFNSNLITIDGTVNVNGNFTNQKNITGTGEISYTNACLGVGTINGYDPSVYCGAGNINLAELTCTNTDTTDPVFTNLSGNQLVYLPENACDISVSWTPPTATDDCELVSVTSNYNAADIFPIGQTTVTYTALDKAGNSSDYSFIVEVLDTISPQITNMPVDIVAYATTDQCGTSVSWTIPDALDNCTVDLTASHSSGDVFTTGVTEVVYTATDQTGNQVENSFSIQVIDSISPVFSTFPSDIVTTTAEGLCTALADWNIPTASDNCSAPVTISGSHTTDFEFPIGVTLVNYTATDADGNATSQSFSVTVNDLSPPVFSFCPGDFSLITEDTIINKSLITWELPVVEDICADITLTSNYQPGDAFANGTTEIIYTAIDSYGNEATCRFNVVSNINIAPEAANNNFYIKAGEELDICLDATDPNGDQIMIQTVNHQNEKASISDIDINNLCFLYQSDKDFYGLDTVYVVLKDDGQPSRSTTIKVIIEVERNIQITINGALSVNGDGINDDWQIENIDLYPNNSVRIFDRWGGLIFDGKGYDNQSVVWRGEGNASLPYKEEFVATGTYFYAIDLGNGDKTITGAIEVIR